MPPADQLAHVTGALVLGAIGAVLAFAVDVEVDWIDVNVAGMIILIVGCIYLLFALLLAFDVLPRRGPRR